MSSALQQIQQKPAGSALLEQASSHHPASAVAERVASVAKTEFFHGTTMGAEGQFKATLTVGAVFTVQKWFYVALDDPLIARQFAIPSWGPLRGTPVVLTVSPVDPLAKTELNAMHNTFFFPHGTQLRIEHIETLDPRQPITRVSTTSYSTMDELHPY